jgi:hypothetical protein
MYVEQAMARGSYTLLVAEWMDRSLHQLPFIKRHRRQSRCYGS